MLILIYFDCNPASFLRSSFRFEFIPRVILSADLRAFDDLEIPPSYTEGAIREIWLLRLQEKQILYRNRAKSDVTRL